MKNLINEIMSIPRKARIQYNKNHDYKEYTQLMKEYNNAVNWLKMCGTNIDGNERVKHNKTED
jgi:hypothetical protein